MRKLAAAAALALTALIAPAHAQVDGTFEGTWAFQTQPYAAGPGTIALMSGAAIMRAESSGYAIQLLANELVTQGGQSVIITARQNCRGVNEAGQFTITCELAEPLEGYQPDVFILQAGEPDQLAGVLQSASSGQVQFTRIR